MRLFLCCVLFFLLSACVVPQDIPQLRQIVDKNAPKSLPNTLGIKKPDADLVNTCKTTVEAADKMLAAANLSESDRRWALLRKASSLIILAYAETAVYYPQLAAVNDELRKSGIKNMGKETEKHSCIIGASLALSGKGDENDRKLKSFAERMTAFVEQNPGEDSNRIIDSFLADLRFLNFSERDPRLAIVAPVFLQHFQKVHYTKKAQVLEQEYQRATLVGKPMYLAGVDLEGNPLNTERLNGKLVLVQFWGTWCPNCKKEMTPLMRLYEKYNAAGLEIIGINTGTAGDKEVKNVKKFVDTAEFEGKKIPWTILHEGLGEQKKIQPVSQFYGIRELPVLILVGRDGKVLRLHPPVGSLDAAIAEAK